MFWPGTLIGIVAGWALASIPGALLGGVLGQILDRRLRRRTWRDLFESLRGDAGVPEEELLFLLLGRIAKSRGRVQDAHIQQARAEMQRLGLDEQGRLRAIDAFSRGKQGGPRLEEGVSQYRGQRPAVDGLLQACWRMGWAAGAPSPAEKALILRWGENFGLPRATVLSLAAGAEALRAPPNRSESYRQALRLLGVEDASPVEEVKRAYRRLISQHHPDKLAGASEACIAAATEKTREIQQAYALVRERRGFR
ncbi:DnaJ domain-containing protein [Pseudomonas citronellolis]|uniref:DnaJ domain-containing protein n=1 Tax=Pseudomonas citronellolis TaxID=53408 RepID=UPI0023E41194|nr:DnaJ domain-containing protein [Pseudomonas citronellolis]MDF3935486.1 DnaJ domain-containing protein [Pseudomonas citronellolis]